MAPLYGRAAATILRIGGRGWPVAPLLAASARPRVADWYARIQDRSSFATAVTDWAPAPMVAMFQKNGAEVWADVEPLTRIP